MGEIAMTLIRGLWLAFFIFLFTAGISCMLRGPLMGAHPVSSMGLVAFVAGLFGIAVITDRCQRF